MKMNLRHFGVGIGSVICLLLSSARSYAASSGIGPDFKGPVGLQLYSLREQFKKDVPGTLDKVKGFGIKYAELAGTYNMTPEKFKDQLVARGIEAVGGHFPYEKFRDDVQGIAIEAKALGL